MLKLEEFRPHFLSFYDAVVDHQDGVLQAGDFAKHSSAFADFLGVLQGRLEWELPLLDVFSEARDLGLQFHRNCTSLLQEIEGDQVRPETVLALQRDLEAIRHCQSELPVFCDVEAFNDILVLATQAKLDPVNLNRSAILQRLPLALNWVDGKERSWQYFAALFPDAEVLPNMVAQVFNALKGACGGIYASFEEQDAGEGLEEACRLLITALKELSQLELQRLKLESEEFGDLEIALGRALMGCEMFETLPGGGRREVDRYLLMRTQTLESLKLQLMCADQEDPPREKLVSSLSRSLGELGQAWSKGPGQTSEREVVEAIIDWEEEFQEKLYGGQAPPEPVVDATLFEEVKVS